MKPQVHSFDCAFSVSVFDCACARMCVCVCVCVCVTSPRTRETVRERISVFCQVLRSTAAGLRSVLQQTHSFVFTRGSKSTTWPVFVGSFSLQIYIYICIYIFIYIDAKKKKIRIRADRFELLANQQRAVAGGGGVWMSWRRLDF